MTGPVDLPFRDIAEHVVAAIYWPLPLTFWPLPVGVLFWMTFLWARASERRALSGRQFTHDPAADFDRGSWLLISQGWRLVRLTAVLAALLTPPWVDGAARYALYGAGLLLMIFGALLRQHCFRMLGEQFTYRVQVSERGGIIQRGIYRWVRHPSYTGGMVYNLGIALALTNWASTALVITGMLVMYFYRVRVEEQALLKVHRDAYGEYMRHTKRFVPFVF
jgi:protein-S-isoprenylcysteine O-methyltransferase Ste14